MAKKSIEERQIVSMSEICSKMMELLDEAFLYRKPTDEKILMLASLLFLKKEDALSIKPEKEQFVEDVVLYYEKNYILHYNQRVFLSITNQEFRALLERTLSKFSEARKPDRIWQIANFMNDLKLEKREFLTILDNVIKGFGGRNIGVFSQPHELSEIVKYLLDPSVHVVFDPFGGLMDFATSLNIVYYANELSSSIRDLAMFRLALADVLDFCVINQTNSIDWTDRNNYDAIVTVPPFGIKLHMRGDGGNGGENSEIVAIKRFEETTNEHGQLITIVPVSFLYSETGMTRVLRERLTRRNLLDCIIQLPGGIFPHTGLVTAVVVLKKQRKEGQPIRFIDSSKCVIKFGQRNVLDVEAIKHLCDVGGFDVTQEEILEQHSSWNLQWYWNRITAVFDDGYKVVRLADVLEAIRPVRRFPETEGRVVNVGSLSSDCFSYEKSPTDFPEKDSIVNTMKVTEPVLLLSLVGSPKPTYCRASEESPIYVKGDVCAFRIKNETIHEGFLCMELAKRLIPTAGILYPRLSKMQILETFIEFPSLDKERSLVEQKNIFEEARQTAEIGKVKEEWLEALLEKKKQEYIQEVRNRKHDMKTPMGQIRNTITLLDSLVDQLSGEQAEKLRLYSQRLRKSADILSEIVSHIADEDVFTNPEPVELDEVLASARQKTDKYVVAYYRDEAAFAEAGIKKSVVKIGRLDLKRLVQNVVDNAVNHGFIGDNPEYSLNITLSIEEGFYVIDFSNNGEPLPEGLTKERYGMKGNPGKSSKGTGTGGYIVKSIVEHYGGDYDIYSQHFAGIDFTHVIVKLPIYQMEDE